MQSNHRCADTHGIYGQGIEERGRQMGGRGVSQAYVLRYSATNCPINIPNFIANSSILSLQDNITGFVFLHQIKMALIHYAT